MRHYCWLVVSFLTHALKFRSLIIKNNNIDNGKNAQKYILIKLINRYNLKLYVDMHENEYIEIYNSTKNTMII